MDFYRENEKLNKDFPSLTGQFLIATPVIGDSYFHNSVILICSHNEYGALGITINRKSPDLHLYNIISNLEDDKDNLSDMSEITDKLADQPIYIGGPVEAGRGFILLDDIKENSIDYIKISDGIYLTYHIEVLKKIIVKKQFDNYLISLGYASWAPKQLEMELEENAWLTHPASSDIIFDVNVNERYKEVIKRIGIDISNLTSTIGHA